MRETANSLVGVDELLNKAFQLAYLIIGDRMTAVRIAMAAMDNLKLASTNQDKRHSYLPTGGSASRAARTKVLLSDIHILQRLVYIESDIYERLQEQHGGTLRQEEWIIRFIKHLVRIITKRNSFYVSLGLSRLLYNYATSEATEIYNLVIQDPDRMRDDYYYRSRKGRLMRELKERFGNRLKTYQSNRREERFHANDESENYASFVKECLLRFTPWFTTCVLPADLDPTKTQITPLLFKGVDPDQENAIEVNRIHTLIHPDCYGRLVSALGFDPPDRRLEVPYFFISANDQGPTDDRFNPPELTEHELNAIKSSLDSKAKRRRGGFGNSLRVYVDGIERARWELAHASSVQLEVDGNSEVIQVRADDASENIVLATHLLAHDDSGIVSSKSAAVAEGGQKVFFSVSSGSSDEPSSAIVNIEFEDTKLVNSISLSLRRMQYRLTNKTALLGSRRRRLFKPALVFLLVVVCIAGLFIYLQSRARKNEQPVISESRGGDSPSRSASNQNESNKQPASPEPASPNNQRRNEPPGGQIATLPRTTRGAQTRTIPAMLLSVRKVYVDPLGNGTLSMQVRAALIDRLQSTSRFTIVGNRNEADAVFKGTATRAVDDPERASVILRLINVKGQVLWPLRKSALRYTGTAADASDKLLRDLLDDIQNLERNR